MDALLISHQMKQEQGALLGRRRLGEQGEEEADFRVVQVVGLHHLIVHVLVDVDPPHLF